jgi:RNA polymerase sigma-B factor
LGDTLGGDDFGYQQVEAEVSLGPALACLGDRDRTVVILRFYGNLTQAEIAVRHGISQMHVSRLVTRSLLRLRDQIDPETLRSSVRDGGLS